MAGQLDPGSMKRERRGRVDELIDKVTARIERRVLFGEGSLSQYDIDSLQSELDGMVGFLRRKLSESPGREIRLSKLFSDDSETSRNALRRWSGALKELGVDKTARRAVRLGSTK